MEEFNLHEMIASYLADVIVSSIKLLKLQWEKVETLRVLMQLRMKEFIFMSAYSHILTRVHHKLAAANCMYLTYTCVKNADMKNNQ